MTATELLNALRDKHNIIMSYRSCDAIIEYYEQNNLEISIDYICNNFSEYKEWELYRKYPISHKNLNCPMDAEPMYFYNHKYPIILSALVKEKYNLSLVKLIPMTGLFLVFEK